MVLLLVHKNHNILLIVILKLSLRSMYIRGSRFLSYNFLQFAIDGKNDSKTKVEKAFFFIFMSSYAEMSF
jgi:hypothetical protein